MNTETKTPQSEPKAVGNYLFETKNVPIEIKNYINSNLPKVQNPDGTAKQPLISTARENGVYRGRVLLNSDAYLVQSLGKDGNSAVIHRKEDLDMTLPGIAKMDADKRLHQFNVMVAYKGATAKVYPQKQPREYEKSLSVNDIDKLAQTAIKDDKLREAFLTEVRQKAGISKAPEKVQQAPEKVQQAPEKAQQAPEKVQQAPEKAQQAPEKAQTATKTTKTVKKTAAKTKKQDPER